MKGWWELLVPFGEADPEGFRHVDCGFEIALESAGGADGEEMGEDVGGDVC